MQTSAADGSEDTIGNRFLDILPTLRRHFGIAFRYFEPERREDALHEATANAFVAFVQLWYRDRQQVALPTPLARYAVARWFAGRRVGVMLNKRDVSSPYAQRQQQIMLERLHRYDTHQATWREVAIADRQTPVPDQAAFRVDFPEWLLQLSRRDRRIALRLAAGESTTDVARRFQLSGGRVSQLRRELHASWLRFHGETSAGAAVGHETARQQFVGS